MIERRTILQLSAAAALVAGIGASPVAFAQAKERLALKGYDPVAYFTDAKPIPGVEAFEYVWDGQRYRFATASHLNLFKANPDKYAPQFGGSCAMNMAAGARRESDPHNWVISNGNLYVFAGPAGAERFRQDANANASKATAHWQSLKTATQ